MSPIIEIYSDIIELLEHFAELQAIGKATAIAEIFEYDGDIAARFTLA